MSWMMASEWPRACPSAPKPMDGQSRKPVLPEYRNHWPWLAWPALALLAGYLLSCHGCHGDEDNELFARASDAAAAREVAHGR